MVHIHYTVNRVCRGCGCLVGVGLAQKLIFYYEHYINTLPEIEVATFHSYLRASRLYWEVLTMTYQRSRYFHSFNYIMVIYGTPIDEKCEIYE